jgi:hypothetical protein
MEDDAAYLSLVNDVAGQLVSQGIWSGILMALDEQVSASWSGADVGKIGSNLQKFINENKHVDVKMWDVPLTVDLGMWPINVLTASDWTTAVKGVIEASKVRDAHHVLSESEAESYVSVNYGLSLTGRPFSIQTYCGEIVLTANACIDNAKTCRDIIQSVVTIAESRNVLDKIIDNVFMTVTKAVNSYRSSVHLYVPHIDISPDDSKAITGSVEAVRPMASSCSAASASTTSQSIDLSRRLTNVGGLIDSMVLPSGTAYAAGGSAIGLGWQRLGMRSDVQSSLNNMRTTFARLMGPEAFLVGTVSPTATMEGSDTKISSNSSSSSSSDAPPLSLNSGPAPTPAPGVLGTRGVAPQPIVLNPAATGATTTAVVAQAHR